MAHADRSTPNEVSTLTDFQRDVLFVLAGVGPANGLAVKHAVGDYREEEVNHGRLYPNLDRLADRGLIDKREADGRANEYELTEHAVAALQSRTEWERERLEGVSA